MNITEWNETWQRIKDRFPNWQPTATESEDWCMGLRVYNPKMVESVGHWVSTTYSSKEPKLAWYIRECEKRKRELNISNSPTFRDDNENRLQEYEERKEIVITRLENTAIEELRKATISVLKDHGHLISKPTSGNPREWKQTLRAMVYQEIYGGEEQ